MLPTLTLKDIRDLGPCYDPSKFLPADWKGNAIDILNVKKCPAKDRLWVVLHENIIPIETMVSFACWNARQGLRVSGQNDERCLKAIKLAEKWVKDKTKVSSQELRFAAAAAAAAYAAAAAAAAADAAAYAAAAAADAAANAADAAADAAAAAADAAANAADAAADAAYAAREQMRQKQIKRLITMLKKLDSVKVAC